MTPGISEQEIEAERKRVEYTDKRKYQQELDKAKRRVVSGIANGEYDGILGIIREYKLDIPKKHLRRIVDFYSENDNSGIEELRDVRWAYRKLGDSKKARSLDITIRLTEHEEHARAVLSAMTDGMM